MGDPQQPAPPAPLDPPMVPFAIGGMALFAVAGLVLWIAGRTGWAGICLAGVLWGTVGLLVMIKHDAGRARRAAADQTTDNAESR